MKFYSNLFKMNEDFFSFVKKKFEIKRKFRNIRKPNKKQQESRIKYILKLSIYLICLCSFIYFFIYAIFLYKKNKKEFIENKEKEIKIENNFDNLKTEEYKQDELTIVTGYYIIKSKHSFMDYYKRINNLVKLNHSMVFFTNKKFINIIKEMRPKNLYYKTIFIDMEMEEFYSYKNFLKEFNESFYIDPENSYQTVPLYMVWAEKCTFLKKVILNNYFKSKCFYWVDAGFFTEQNSIDKFINWPSTRKCLENPRVLINLVTPSSDSVKKGLINFDLETHKQFQLTTNVGAGVFGGQPEYLLKFIDYYYESIRLFISHKIFIGKEQNIFTFVAYKYPDIINLVYSGGNYYYFKDYLLD